jgi:hypothetical protein
MRDEIGNELHEGDLVMVMMGTTSLRGKVIRIQHGGIVGGVRGRSEQTMPAVVEVACTVSLSGPPHPKGTMMNLVRLVDPDAAGESESVSKPQLLKN